MVLNKMTITKKILQKITFIVLISISISACSKKELDNDIVIPADILYSKGVELLKESRFEKASAEFEKVFFQHPGKEITPKAELMQAYSLYKAGENEESIDVLDIFIRLHPRHKEVGYAYYLKGLNSYAQISDIELDQSNTRFALDSFQEVIKRFPNSKYAADSRKKLVLVKNYLAGKEMDIGRYYLNKKNPIAAISRFQEVHKKYSDTSHDAESLYRIVESQMMIGIKEEAIRYHAILAARYPNSKWLGYSSRLVK